MIGADVDSTFGGKTALVTGATGFVGSNLLSVLLQSKSFRSGSLKLICVTRRPDALRAKWSNLGESLRILEWDIRTPLRQALPVLDFVFHFAGDSRIIHRGADRSSIVDATIAGTKNVLEASSRLSVPKVILASSGAVYGSAAAGTPFREDSLIEPNDSDQVDSYRVSKRAAELICRDFNSSGRAEVVIARMFTFVGPYLPLDSDFAIGNFIQDCLESRLIRVNSDGSSIRSYQYSLDMINWLLTILVRGKSGQIYNVGSSEEISILELSELVAKVCGNRHGVKVIGLQGQDPAPTRYVPSIEKAVNELELYNQFPLSRAISATYELLLKSDART